MNFNKEIKEKAKILGFDLCNISKAEELSYEKAKLNEWLNNEFHGDMQYMSRNIDKRTNPSLLVENCKSIISVLINYFPQQSTHPESHYKISKYALGKDYHYVIKDKLKILMSFINDKYPSANMRAFTDSAPIFDKTWAIKAGLGWQGKNSLMINKKLGSYFFIGEILIDIDLEPDTTESKNYCGSCTKCIDSCPTRAIVEPYIVDSRKCISYLTLESKTSIPENLVDKLDNNICGCDICQDVCPWNSKVKASTEPLFKISSSLASMRKEDWENLQKPDFKRIFKSTPLERIGYNRLKYLIDLQRKK